MNFFLLTAFYFITGSLGVGTYLWGKPDGNSFYDRCYRVICVYFPSTLKKALDKLCGRRGPAALDWLWSYIRHRRNPLVQLIYLCAVVGGFLAFAAHGFPHLPGGPAGGVHRYLGSAIFCACLGVWGRACTADPGTVTDLNVDELCEIYEWDNQIFANSNCKTCKFAKPARSNHCPLCNVCVARFDHHSVWISNCVGVGNHRWFLGFLFWHLVLCFYGAGMGSMIVYNIVSQRNLFKAVFVDPVTRERHKANSMIVLQYLLGTEGMLVFVCLLSAVMGLVLGGLLLWHLHLVRTGTTTNELGRWSYFRLRLMQEGEEGKARLKNVTNIYNKGFLSNFREVLFPPNVHRLPASQQASAAGRGGGKKDEKRKGKDKAKRG